MLRLFVFAVPVVDDQQLGMNVSRDLGPVGRRGNRVADAESGPISRAALRSSESICICVKSIEIVSVQACSFSGRTKTTSMRGRPESRKRSSSAP